MKQEADQGSGKHYSCGVAARKIVVNRIVLMRGEVMVLCDKNVSPYSHWCCYIPCVEVDRW